jgi:NAD(P)-dependent dehydrogenase (short-subunit alcohol dehydrogenase family)
MSPQESDFTGKVAIVTAGGGGIGRAIAERLAALGAAVVIADRSAANGMAAVREIESSGGRAACVEMDLGRAEDAARTVQAAVDAFGRLDILINNASILGALKPIIDLDPAEWEEVIRTNLTGTFLLTQASVRRMLAQGEGGAIVNILAIQEHMPLPDHGAYAASKGGLAAFTRALAVELAGQGIRVNGIAAGSIYTEGVRGELAPIIAGDAPADAIPAATLLGRMGRPDEVAAVAVFLASPQASFIAGAIVPVEGGRLLSRNPDPFLIAQQARRRKL